MRPTMLCCAPQDAVRSAIGLSNVCASLLRCLARTVRIRPAVLQYMHHVGMGVDAFGYRSYGEREWGATYMAYSALGGAEQSFHGITHAAPVVVVAREHHTHPANVALSWVAQQGMPLVVISADPQHLRQNMALFSTPPWGRLSQQQMRVLSELREPGGRPSYWGACEDEQLSHPSRAERPLSELRRRTA